jgi:hypothetical protein
MNLFWENAEVSSDYALYTRISDLGGHIYIDTSSLRMLIRRAFAVAEQMFHSLSTADLDVTVKRYEVLGMLSGGKIVASYTL